MNPKSSLGIGVIGTGGVGSRHVNNIQQRISGAHVVGLFDVDAARLATLTATTCPEATVFATPAALINDERVEAVHIASPNDKHSEQTWQCVQAGKPVLCEKPLATTAAEAWRVIEAETALNRGW
jgi:myo-inositol 2-dehydrogenase/D-chiro-inositol 1-dehydrogenase